MGNYTATQSVPGTLPLGRWTHVAHTMDRVTHVGQTYIDGVPSGGPDNISQWVAAIDCSSPMLTASVGGWGNDFHFAGGIDDMRFYSRALSAAEVAALAARTTSGCL